MRPCWPNDGPRTSGLPLAPELSVAELTAVVDRAAGAAVLVGVDEATLADARDLATSTYSDPAWLARVP